MADRTGGTLDRVLFVLLTSETVASTATETKITGATVPANTLQPGSVLTLEAFGVVGTTSNATLAIKLYFGSTAVLTRTVTTVSPTGTPSFYLKARATCLTNGASGTMLFALWMSTFYTAVDGVTPAGAIVICDTTADSVDTTADSAFQFSVTFEASSASNTMTVAQEAVFFD